MIKRVFWFAGLLLVAPLSSSAAAQTSAQNGAQPFNPFASFSLSRYTFNTLGFLQVAPASPFAAGGTAAAAPAPAAPASVVKPQALVVRPPYVPPHRSPYRPPPRPPF